jgi:molybdenum cofactor cytidylyltransferase
MNALPTVIILADPQMATQPHPGDAAMNHVSALDTTLRRVLASDLPRVLVAPTAVAQAASATLPGQDIIACAPPQHGQSHSDWLAHCVATAVLHRPEACGWLLLPADMPMLNVKTLLAVAQSLPLAPIVFPCHRHMRGHPVGLSSELYADLVRMQGDKDLRRLTARYPSVDVDVDDAGVLMTLDAHTGLNQLRASLTGPYRASPFAQTM